MMERPQRAMAVFAHPDDEIACAGTIAKWTKDGTEVAFVVCTNGDKGTEDRGMTPERLAQIRVQEQRDAAAALEVRDVVFLGYPDGELEDTREFRGKLVRELRRFRPQVVLTHAPLNLHRHSHRDHRVCGTVTLDAIFPYARDPWHYAALTEAGLAPHKVEVVLLWGSESPDLFMDISDTMDVKTQAMMCHRSQFVERRGRDPNRVPGQFVRERAKEVGEQAGLPFAEAFQKISFRG
ncbi:MAG: PIG-L family deacetylase [Chloroflexi bacterium]|nr:PIG-L family deacetylase [Chloroflexota bacterium]